MVTQAAQQAAGVELRAVRAAQAAEATEAAAAADRGRAALGDAHASEIARLHERAAAAADAALV